MVKLLEAKLRIIEFLNLFEDTNKDGKINSQEFLSGIYKNGSKVSFPIAMNLFKQFDKNNDGQISVEEVKEKITVDYLNEISEEAVKEIPDLFKSYDKNKDDLISYDELAEAYKVSHTYYKEWTDWSFAVVNKKKTEKLTKVDIGVIIFISFINEDDEDIEELIKKQLKK